MKRKLIIIDKDTGEELERVEFTGGYNIAVTNMHDEDAKGFDIVC
ncbi:hypothetical protein [Tepidibacter hydrothermalis]|uniref:Uncharacterized protein n=1 Tax=Tepidibacter hydrothermalis TaxID=3036126 RepID=A0ABY8EK10_9FIRM|nr:hypothetical protein [Tepidibacter hydrothermalis]WFD12419.1 hypothetical protein P4S50_09870 [Tepidibacter hydrothermalis]